MGGELSVSFGTVYLSKQKNPGGKQIVIQLNRDGFSFDSTTFDDSDGVQKLHPAHGGTSTAADIETILYGGVPLTAAQVIAAQEAWGFTVDADLKAFYEAEAKKPSIIYK